jgi:hypothetical protein
VSTLVQRDGAQQITVHDEEGREVALVCSGGTLRFQPKGETPRLTPQMAHELADELHQWATCQQTVRVRTSPRRRR